MPPSPDSGATNSGFVLLPVIWIVFFLALATMTFTLVTRSNVHQVSSATASASAAALADAGVNLALYDLANARANRNWKRRFPVDSLTYVCTIGTARVGITISDEAGKVDLNGAQRPLLVALLRGLGESNEQAQRLASAIEDFRDPDDTRRPQGAEQADYRQAGRKAGPKNAAFETPFELAQVLGFDRSILDKVLPHVTVHTGLSGIDPARASPALLEIAKSGAAAEGAGTISAGLPPNVLSTSNQRILAVRAQSANSGGVMFALEAIVASSTASGLPDILARRQVTASPLLDGVALGEC